MLDTIIGQGEEQAFTFSNIAIVFITAIILGIIISVVYIKTNQKKGYTPSFAVTLIMLPIIISIIILLIGNNVARAFSLAGAFSIIRFRSNAGDPKDLSYVFLTLAVGLACGMGYVGYGVLITVVLSAVMIAIDKIHYGESRTKTMELKITVPENLNYDEIFFDILDNYTVSWRLEKIKTKEFGSLFQVVYRIQLKPSLSSKKMIDELRTRNGNLEVQLILGSLDEKVYA